MVSLLFILIHTGKGVFVTVCALPWSVPHVFDITVTRLPSLSGEMENVRD